MNFFIALILLIFLFLLSNIVPIPHDFSQEQINTWKKAPFDGVEFLPNIQNDVSLCQWLGWNMSRGALPTLVMVFLFPTLAPFFGILVILAQIYIPRYQRNSILKPRFELHGFLGSVMISNPICFLASVFSATSVYFVLGDHCPSQNRIHSAIFSGMLALVLMSGIKGGAVFLPIFLGVSIMCYRNFGHLKQVLRLIPDHFQVWTHDDVNNQNRDHDIVYEASAASSQDFSDTRTEGAASIKDVIIDIKSEHQIAL